MKIAIGADHGGFNYKSKIKDFLRVRGIDIIDVGTNSTNSCDYPEFAHKVAELITTGEAELGILVCGTGIGMSITANKHKGIRASHCTDTFSAKATREHNNSNVLCLGERILGEEIMLQIVETWINTPFSNDERHIRRINRIELD